MRPGGASAVPEPEYVDEILPEHLPSGELSIAVFGPGKGEAIVVRMPDGALGVVDGCREPTRGTATGSGDPVRELLRHFEEQWEEPKPFRLAFVCLTHPHSDHYSGLGRLLKAYEGRVQRIWTISLMSGAYAEALPAWVEMTRAGRKALPDEKELKGLRRVIEHMQRATEDHGAVLHDIHVGMSLLGSSNPSEAVRVTACGPTSRDLRQAGLDLIETMNARAKRNSKESICDPNLTSGALLIQWEEAGVLLAGDLLSGQRPDSGWQQSLEHVCSHVQVVNVAHHASFEAHFAPLWEKMRPSLSIVTPFKHGTKPNPPRPDEISVLAKSSVVAITSPPNWQGEPNVPVGMKPIPPRSYEALNNILPIQPSGTADARRNAVAVSLDATGKITRFVLAGKADVYLTPEEHASLAPPAPPAAP